MDGIDSDRLADALRVLAEVEQLPTEHPDAVAVRRAVGGLFKTVKEQRRAERRAAIRANDEAVTAATATGAPGRIDDETQGLALTSSATGEPGGHARARPRVLRLQAALPATSTRSTTSSVLPARRSTTSAATRAPTSPAGARCSPAAGRRSGCTSRCGCCATARTRRSRRASRTTRSGASRAMDDSAEWIDRLRVVGIDLRDPGQVIALADEVAAQGPLDILINNAAQTVRRSPAAYAHLAAAAQAPLPSGPLPEVVTLGRAATAAANGLPSGHWSPTPQALTALALTAGSASAERIAAGTAIDAGGLAPDLHPHNSWSQVVDEVDPVELLEVQLCNQTAPFILISRLRPALAASAARRTYVVNVSAMEGQFSRGYKGPGHPHTNMAKAALNMLTRTSAKELLVRRHPHDERRHRLDHRRAPAPDEDAARRGGVPRAARPRRRRGARLRPDRPRRGGRGRPRRVPQGLRFRALVGDRNGRSGWLGRCS